MNDSRHNQEDYRTLQLMNELEQDDSISQRELAGRLGVAVGLVNSYLKNLAAKGLLRVKNYPRNRYGYLLTPKGIAEKSRLAYQHMHYFNNLYTVVRQDYLALFQQLKENGTDAVIFCGVDEVAEIASLSLQEASLALSVVIDSKVNKTDFLGRNVQVIESWQSINDLPIVLTSLKRSRALRQELQEKGVAEGRVFAPKGSG
jgi:Mn-dependent DtxR family transcriptional regulator